MGYQKLTNSKIEELKLYLSLLIIINIIPGHIFLIHETYYLTPSSNYPYILCLQIILGI